MLFNSGELIKLALFKMSKAYLRLVCGLIAILMSASGAADQPRHFPNIGRAAKAVEIKAWDIAIGPHGNELPTGSGSVSEGRDVYAKQCAYCHGATGTEGPDHRLVGGQNSLQNTQPVKTIGSYWPYATTLFDYIARAMPFLAPGSLTPDQVYAVTAYLLHANQIVDKDAVLDKSNLAKVVMPNRQGFVPDARPEEFK